MGRALTLLLGCLLAGCAAGVASQTTLPTARIALAPSATIGIVLARSQPTASSTPPAPTAIPPTTIPPTQTPSQPLSSLDQYRAWMEEARAKHPYPEPVDAMWSVMICESSGNPDIVGSGTYHGLFQYSQQTWLGDWNMYRDSSIFDARAQIFATAKAWNEGHQHWWGCYGR